MKSVVREILSEKELESLLYWLSIMTRCRVCGGSTGTTAQKVATSARGQPDAALTLAPTDIISKHTSSSLSGMLDIMHHASCVTCHNARFFSKSVYQVSPNSSCQSLLYQSHAISTDDALAHRATIRAPHRSVDLNYVWALKAAYQRRMHARLRNIYAVINHHHSLPGDKYILIWTKRMFPCTRRPP